MALTPWDRAKSGTEHGEQSALFMWCNMAAVMGLAAANDPLSYTKPGHAKAHFDASITSEAALYRGFKADVVPLLKRLYAIKNQGHGDKVRGANSKAEGVKPGVPDVFFPVTTPQFAGLYIELKRSKSARGAAGKASDEQEEWAAYLRSQHYRVEFCVGWEAARDVLLNYLGIGA